MPSLHLGSGMGRYLNCVLGHPQCHCWCSDGSDPESCLMAPLLLPICRIVYHGCRLELICRSSPRLAFQFWGQSVLCRFDVRFSVRILVFLNCVLVGFKKKLVGSYKSRAMEICD